MPDDVTDALSTGYEPTHPGSASGEHVTDLRQAGRKYGVEQRTEALRLLAGGKTAGEVCGLLDVPRGTLAWWRRASPEYSKAYAHAIRAGAEHLAAETVEIADECAPEKDEVNRARLRVQARQWLSGKYDPATYGDRVEVQHTGEVEVRRTRFRSLLGDRKVIDAQVAPNDATQAERPGA